MRSGGFQQVKTIRNYPMQSPSPDYITKSRNQQTSPDCMTKSPNKQTSPFTNHRNKQLSKNTNSSQFPSIPS